MAPYVNDVAVRWSDQDAYGHVNHARVVTLLEDARTGLLFDAATRAGVSAFEAGLLVATLEVSYRRPIPWTPAGVRVEMTARNVRAASFLLDYRLLLPDGSGGGGFDEAKPAVTATTQLVPYDLATGRPRRLTVEEREFLAAYTGDEAQRSSTLEAGDDAQRSSTLEAGDDAQRSSTLEAGDDARRSSSVGTA